MQWFSGEEKVQWRFLGREKLKVLGVGRCCAVGEAVRRNGSGEGLCYGERRSSKTWWL